MNIQAHSEAPPLVASKWPPKCFWSEMKKKKKIGVSETSVAATYSSMDGVGCVLIAALKKQVFFSKPKYVGSD